MKLVYHFLASSLLCGVLYPFFGNYAFLVFLTGFFIDLDHYPVYVFKFRGLNPFKAKEYFYHCEEENVLCIFHTVEFFIAMVILAVFSAVGCILLGGLFMHHVMETYNEFKLGKPRGKAKFLISALWGRVE